MDVRIRHETWASGPTLTSCSVTQLPKLLAQLRNNPIYLDDDGCELVNATGIQFVVSGKEAFCEIVLTTYEGDE